MDTLQIWQTTTNDLAATNQLAEQIGRRLRGGELIELVSDLGGGKTTFVKGLARGLGSSDHVSSPSFTLSNEYTAGDHTLYHFDFYRLSEPGIMRQELAEILADERAIVVIEWAEIVADIVPLTRMLIEISVTGEQSRQFSFRFPQRLAYLLGQESV